MGSKRVLQELAVAAELMGHELSETALKAMAADLGRWPDDAVVAAIQRMRRECDRMRLAYIVDRIDDGRPSPDEAWAMIPVTEAESVVWTSEMAEAYGAAAPLVMAGDRIAARMAFLDAYRRITRSARDQAIPVSWVPSLGWDESGRVAALTTAIERGRISRDKACKLCPLLAQGDQEHGLMRRIASSLVKRT